MCIIHIRSDSDEESKQLRFFAPEFTLTLRETKGNVGLENDDGIVNTPQLSIVSQKHYVLDLYNIVGDRDTVDLKRKV